MRYLCPVCEPVPSDCSAEDRFYRVRCCDTHASYATDFIQRILARHTPHQPNVEREWSPYPTQRTVVADAPTYEMWVEVS